MIAVFPEIYEDELAYSLFARHHVHSGHLTYRATAEELFQNRDIIPSVEFLVALTGEAYGLIESQMPFSDFIEKHTMLPYYTRFLPLERRKRAFQLLMQMDRTFYDALYMRRNKTQRRQYMRYCPLCAAADRERHGETYWHRKHQLTGIDICLGHRCRLESSKVGIVSDELRFRLTTAEEEIPKEILPNRNVSDVECSVAEYVLQIFEADMDLENDVMTGDFLHEKLRGTRYTTSRGEQVLARNLFEDLTEFYCSLTQNTIEQWWHVQKIFCDQNFHTYDICLTAMFLKVSAEDLIRMRKPVPIHQQFDNQIFSLHNSGKTYAQIANIMGVSLDAVKAVGERRYRSTQKSLAK